MTRGEEVGSNRDDAAALAAVAARLVLQQRVTDEEHPRPEIGSVDSQDSAMLVRDDA